jgi:hypothetical protein
MRSIFATSVALGGLAALGAAAPSHEAANILAERALGINCRGSALCSQPRLGEIAEFIQGIDISKTYQNGENIACWTYVFPQPSTCCTRTPSACH